MSGQQREDVDVGVVGRPRPRTPDRVPRPAVEPAETDGRRPGLGPRLQIGARLDLDPDIRPESRRRRRPIPCAAGASAPRACATRNSASIGRTVFVRRSDRVQAQKSRTVADVPTIGSSLSSNRVGGGRKRPRRPPISSSAVETGRRSALAQLPRRALRPFPRRRSARSAIPLESLPVTDLARSRVSLPRRLAASTPSAPVSSALSLDLRGRVRPSSRLQRLAAGLDPEPPVEVDDGDRDMVARLHHGRRLVGCSSTFELAVPAAASMRANRRSVLREMSSSRSCRAAFSPRRCRSSSSGDASSTRSSSSTAIASCSWKQRARTASHS